MQQLTSLRATYNSDRWNISSNGFTWWFRASPTPLSETYLLKIVYKQNYSPKIYVVEPNPLQLAQGAKRLPHTYSTTEQQLCLYRPKNYEWTESELISRTIVHWALEWLFYYEEWAYSGIWHGGGHGSWDVKPEEEEK